MNVIKVKKGFVLKDSDQQQKVLIDNVRLQVRVDGDDIEILLANMNEKKVQLKLKGEPACEVMCANIVYIQSIKGNTGVSSNNKEVFFTHRPPGLLVDFTMAKDLQHKWNVAPSEFVEIIRGISVNRRWIKELNDKNELVVMCQNQWGKQVVKKLAVSRRKLPFVRQMVKYQC